MGDIPGDSPPSEGPPLYDTGGISPGGQVYTTTVIGKYVYEGLRYLSEYGWYVVLIMVCMGVVWVKVGPAVREWWRKRKEREDELNFDPVRAERYEDGILHAREKMQNLQDEKASEHQQKMEERAAREREEKIQQWETFGTVSKPKKPKPKKLTPTPLRHDYFPLSGHGGGGGYRPTRRYPSGGGG